MPSIEHYLRNGSHVPGLKEKRKALIRKQAKQFFIDKKGELWYNGYGGLQTSKYVMDKNKRIEILEKTHK